MFINYLKKTSETFISDEIEFLSRQNDVDLEVLHYGDDIKSGNVKGLKMPASFIKRLVNNPSLFTINYIKSLKYRNGQNTSLGYLIDFFKKNQYDTIYCHFGTNGKLIAELKELGVVPKETKLVVRFHGLDLNFNKYPTAYYKVLAQYADRILSGSDFAIDKLKKYKIYQSKIIKLPVGIKEKNILKEPLKKGKPEKFTILSVGRFIELKGHREAILVCDLLKKRQLSFTFKIIGSGELENELRSLIQEKYLASEIEIISALPHEMVLEEMKNAQVFLYSGIYDKDKRSESQGLVNIEAMGIGLPIIASNIGGIPDYVKDKETGFLCEPGNIEQFADTLEWVIQHYDSKEILEIRKNAINKVKENYSQEKLNRQLLEILTHS